MRAPADQSDKRSGHRREEKQHAIAQLTKHGLALRRLRPDFRLPSVLLPGLLLIPPIVAGGEGRFSEQARCVRNWAGCLVAACEKRPTLGMTDTPLLRFQPTKSPPKESRPFRCREGGRAQAIQASSPPLRPGA